MKKMPLPLFLLLCLSSVYSQEFKSEKINAGQWDTNVLLHLKATDGQEEINIMTKSKKISRSQKEIKQLKINTESYQMVESCGTINILNNKGETILKTNGDRSEITLPYHEQFTRKKLKGNKGSIEYLDAAGHVVVSGQLQNGVIELKNHTAQDQHALLALCLEELVQYAFERYMHAMMISSFLVQTD